MKRIFIAIIQFLVSDTRPVYCMDLHGLSDDRLRYKKSLRLVNRAYWKLKVSHMLKYERYRLAQKTVRIVILLTCIVFGILFLQKKEIINITKIYTTSIDKSIPKQNHEFEIFCYELGMKESTDNYECHNKGSQYYGKYQMGNDCFKTLHLENYPKDKFLKDHKLQDWALYTWLKEIRKDLRKDIEKWDGKWCGHYYMSESGMVAAAHLVGPSRVREFLKSNGRVIPCDGNGTPMTSYSDFFAKRNLIIK